MKVQNEMRGHRFSKWLRRVFTWKSPNHRISSIVGGITLVFTGNLLSTYWDHFAVLVPDLPFLGGLTPWIIAGVLGWVVDIFLNKFLDKIKPEGRAFT